MMITNIDENQAYLILSATIWSGIIWPNLTIRMLRHQEDKYLARCYVANKCEKTGIQTMAELFQRPC